MTIIWLFNPLTWYNSSIWGQTDPIVNVLGLIAILGLLGTFELAKRFGELKWFSFWFTVAFLFKPSLSIFIPILLIIVIKRRYTFSNWIQSAALSLSTVVITSFWFHPYINFIPWFIDLYQNRILPGEIGYLTANAFNIWWLVDSGKVLDSTLYWGLSARFLGLITVIGGLGGVGWWFTTGELTTKKIFLSLATSALLAFLFLTRIHERYLYPFFPYATLMLGVVPKFWIPYIVLSITYLLNMYHLFWAPPIPYLETYLSSWGGLISIVNIITFFYLLRHLRSSNI